MEQTGELTVYLCQDSFDGILCGVYDAWMSRKGHKNVKLELDEGGNFRLFCSYVRVETSAEKAQKVRRAILEQISAEVFEMVYLTALSFQENRADAIYRFLICGFHWGAKVIDMLQVPAVFEVFQVCRNVRQEAHLMQGFTRFSQMRRGILLGNIQTKNFVLPLLAAHFSDRMPEENWILHDQQRKQAAVHRRGFGWVLTETDSPDWQENLTRETDEGEYQILWKTFFDSIAIGERTNPRCQRNLLPLRFRSCMTEFQDLHPVETYGRLTSDKSIQKRNPGRMMDGDNKGESIS